MRVMNMVEVSNIINILTLMKAPPPSPRLTFVNVCNVLSSHALVSHFMSGGKKE